VSFRNLILGYLDLVVDSFYSNKEFNTSNPIIKRIASLITDVS
jgi:hypothetical protein